MKRTYLFLMVFLVSALSSELMVAGDDFINQHVDYVPDKNRLIAHAGGEIDGHRYTNSLEALDYNYNNGFRLFELDISKTSDNYYVAAHDWKSWTKFTGHKGPLVPDKETFNKYKIRGLYTPMDMDRINAWFKAHPDAILVTDKINEPLEFSRGFIDKDRLMMELFTWHAVREAIHAGIRSAIPTHSLLDSIEGDKVSFLKSLNIKDVAVDRLHIGEQKDLMSMIAESGINAYAFNLHNGVEVEEKYVMCNELKYFYGIYADKWDFSSPLACNQSYPVQDKTRVTLISRILRRTNKG
jgi:hypothetical protein